MRYFLFLLVNAALFIRPGEILPELAAVQVYLILILFCLLCGLPVVLMVLTRRYPSVPPIIGCVLALFPAILLSHLSHMNVDEAALNGTEYFKVLIYFLLLVGLVDSPLRLRGFLCWTTVFFGAMALLAVVNFHGPATAPNAETGGADPKDKNKIHGAAVIERAWDPELRRMVDVRRLCGPGLFNDPNELAVGLVTGMILCLYFFMDRRGGPVRPLWLGLFLFFGYAFTLTHSRGGFIAFVAGMATLFHARFGTRRSLLLGMLGLPVIMVLFADRMTSISTSDGTGQSRIQLWSDGLMYFREAPVFGIGMEVFRQRQPHVAHNSFIHCYAELGLLGGTLFLGAFYLAVRAMLSVRPAPAHSNIVIEKEHTGGEHSGEKLTSPSEEPPAVDAVLTGLYPYLLAVVIAYTVGILFLSRSYVVPTYLILGVATIYLRLRSARPPSSMTWPRFPLVRLAGVSMAFLACAFLFVRSFVRWG